MVHVYLPFSAGVATKLRDEIEAKYGFRLFNRIAVADVVADALTDTGAEKGNLQESYFELTVGDNLMALSNTQVHEIFTHFVSAGLDYRELV